MIDFRQKIKSLNYTKLLLIVASWMFIFVAGYGVGKNDLGIADLTGEPAAVSHGLPKDLDYESVEQVYDSLRLNYDGELSAEDLVTGLKDGLVKATGDPFTEFLDKEEAQSFNEDLSGTFTGIGAELSKDGDMVVIVAPIAGFPAEKAGLRSGDIITEIDDESAYNISVTEAVDKIRGPADTDVTLKIVRNKSQELTFKITRAEIKIPSVEAEIVEGNIGHLKISRFGEDTVRLSREAILDFQRQNVKGIILDMRSNPGGLLDASVSLADLWLERGDVILEEKRGGKTSKTYTASGEPLVDGLPTVVLINEGSASASEIVAGALKDNGVATLIGVKTFGKGSVQELIRLSGQTVLKVTVARWYTPDGRNIDKEGIEPDNKVERTEEDFEADRDPQLDAAVKKLKS